MTLFSLTIATDVHYKRFAQEQNKRVWTYYISVDCFIGICEYVRHAARKKIANLWVRNPYYIICNNYVVHVFVERIFVPEGFPSPFKAILGDT